MFSQALDLDSHEFMPVHFYPEVFGEVGAVVQEIWEQRRASYELNPGGIDHNNIRRPDITGDNAVIDPETIGETKGVGAPGAIDPLRRPAVLDAMGIERAFIFPTFGFIGMTLWSLDDAGLNLLFDVEPGKYDQKRIGLEAIRAHNDWSIKLASEQDRIRPVAVVPSFSLDAMMSEAQRAIDGGLGAVWLLASAPPARTAPANPKLDPFWSLMEEHDMPVVLHLNLDPFMGVEWEDAPQFKFQLDSLLVKGAYYTTTFSFAVENFLANMVIGGVFDRHPRLRFGIIECGAQWLGPLAERMEMLVDFWSESRKLERRPAQYIADQVRVTPFFYEPVDLYLERYPQIATSYCFSTDYPHAEGGMNAMRGFRERLEPFGDEAVTRFFRTNAELLLPS